MSLITAIIPTYKRPQWLKRAVRSFLAQTFTDFQVLIADNSSGPETDRVVQELMRQDKRVQLLQHPTNIGLTATLQMALMQVTSPYFCFLPDDDFVGPTFFEETLPKFSEHPDIAFCGGGGLIINQEYVCRRITALKQSIPPSGYYSPPSSLFAFFHSSFGIALSGCLFKTALAKEVGGFDQRIRIGIDIDLVAKCCAKFPVYFMADRPFYFAFHHAGCLSLTRTASSDEQESVYLHENIRALLPSTKAKEEIDLFFQKRHFKNLSITYSHFCSVKDFAQARSCAENLYALTQSKRWKRKMMEARLYGYFPFLFSLNSKLKTIEKKLRRSNNKQPAVQNHTPEDSAKWKDYILKLERNE